MNLIGCETCRKNRIGFPVNDEWFTFPKDADRLTYRQIYNMRFHIAATRWKNSNTLQFIISFINTAITEVSRRRVQYIYQVFCPEDVTAYHHNIYGFYQVEQLRDHGSGLSFKSHFKSVTSVVAEFCVILVY